MKVYDNVLEMIGDTPVVKLKSYSKPGIEVFLKLEFKNPGGSIKDRPALKIIEEAEKRGDLKPGGTIVEATSGNTGIGLSLVGAAKGYGVKIAMPENMSIERQKIMKAYGAELILTPKEDGMQGAIKTIEELGKDNPEYFVANQFSNSDNPKAHMESTALEIIKQMDNELDYFVNGIGTGGTVSGVGKVIKQKMNNVKIIGVEPSGSAVVSGEKPGAHKLQGIGAGFIPKILNVGLLDEVILIENEEAYEEARMLAKKEGLMVGISTGANLAAVRKLVSRIESYRNVKILTMSASSGERYLSTDLYE